MRTAKTDQTQAFFMRTAKTLIRLGGCPGWSESSLGAPVIFLVCNALAYIHWMKQSNNRRKRAFGKIQSFAPYSMDSCGFIFRAGNRRLWWDCADAQMYLHMPEGRFLHTEAYFKADDIKKKTKSCFYAPAIRRMGKGNIVLPCPSVRLLIKALIALVGRLSLSVGLENGRERGHKTFGFNY